MRLHALATARPVDDAVIQVTEFTMARSPRPLFLLRAAAVRAVSGPGAVRRVLPSFPPRSAGGALVMPCGRSIG